MSRCCGVCGSMWPAVQAGIQSRLWTSERGTGLYSSRHLQLLHSLHVSQKLSECLVSKWMSTSLALRCGHFKAEDGSVVMCQQGHTEAWKLLSWNFRRQVGKRRLWGRRKNTTSSCIGNVFLFIGCEGSTYRLKLKTLNTKGQGFPKKFRAADMIQI